MYILQTFLSVSNSLHLSTSKYTWILPLFIHLQAHFQHVWVYNRPSSRKHRFMVLEITESFNIDGILFNIIISLCMIWSDHSSQTSRLEDQGITLIEDTGNQLPSDSACSSKADSSTCSLFLTRWTAPVFSRMLWEALNITFLDNHCRMPLPSW